MNINRSLVLRDYAKVAIYDLFSRAEHFGLSHDQMLTERAAIYAETAQCPRWVKSYLNGVWDTLQAAAYHSDLVFGGKVDGVFYSTHSARDDYYQKHGIEPREFADDGKVTDRGHYWSRTLKPFFTTGQ